MTAILSSTPEFKARFADLPPQGFTGLARLIEPCDKKEETPCEFPELKNGGYIIMRERWADLYDQYARVNGVLEDVPPTDFYTRNPATKDRQFITHASGLPEASSLRADNDLFLKIPPGLSPVSKIISKSYFMKLFDDAAGVKSFYMTWAQAKAAGLFATLENPLEKEKPLEKVTDEDSPEIRALKKAMRKPGEEDDNIIMAEGGPDYNVINVSDGRGGTYTFKYPRGTAVTRRQIMRDIKERDGENYKEDRAKMYAEMLTANSIVPLGSFQDTSYMDLPEGFKILDKNRKLDRIITVKEWEDAIKNETMTPLLGLDTKSFERFVENNLLNESLLQQYPKGASYTQLLALHEKYAQGASQNGRRPPEAELDGYGILGRKDEDMPLFRPRPQPKPEKDKDVEKQKSV